MKENGLPLWAGFAAAGTPNTDVGFVAGAAPVVVELKLKVEGMAAGAAPTPGMPNENAGVAPGALALGPTEPAAVPVACKEKADTSPDDIESDLGVEVGTENAAGPT